MTVRAGGPVRVMSFLRVPGAVGIAHRRPTTSTHQEGEPVKLTPEERAEFRRELPVVILAAILLFLVLGAMLWQVPAELLR